MVPAGVLTVLVHARWHPPCRPHATPCSSCSRASCSPRAPSRPGGSGESTCCTLVTLGNATQAFSYCAIGGMLAGLQCILCRLWRSLSSCLSRLVCRNWHVPKQLLACACCLRMCRFCILGRIQRMGHCNAVLVTFRHVQVLLH